MKYVVQHNSSLCTKEGQYKGIKGLRVFYFPWTREDLLRERCDPKSLLKLGPRGDGGCKKQFEEQWLQRRKIFEGEDSVILQENSVFFAYF